ncbi:MAG TPA: vitamin K epoxide reductase family protein, partial [Verrucomicrobiae bacterium]|nr:vitamin K epoxide reductase family protein [Verrucomicrobiae bacterium]
MNDRGNKEELPPGWSYNPSRWRHRLPLVLAACVGLAIALYLTAYQMRWIKRVEDPFFGYGSDIVLNSPLSTLLPIPDAALGALGYFVDVAAGLIGGSLRWKTLPWMVL